MVKDNQTSLNRFHILLDALVTAVSYMISWYIVIGSGWAASLGKSTLEPGLYFSILIILIPVYLMLYSFSNLYSSNSKLGLRSEFGKILRANTAGIFIFVLVLYLTRKNPYSYNFSQRVVVFFYVINVVMMTLERNAVRMLLRSMHAKGYNLTHILIVGLSGAAEEFIDRVKRNPELGYDILGILDDNCAKGSEYKDVGVIGTTGDLADILESNDLDEIAVTLSLREYDKLRDIVNTCERSGVHTKFIPDYGNVIPTIPYTEDFDGLPVIHIRHVPLNDFWNAAAKRMVDIVGSIFGLIIFSPVMLVVAIAIKATSQGPVIFSQERVGLHNKPFKMYKFRSMVVQDPDDEQKKWTTPEDPRVTKVGKFIRRTSIDEIPQFFNVLKGDMSLVGPRPERPLFVEKFRDEIPRYMIKHQVRPGLTGWAQVNGYRGDTSIKKRIEYDLYYIENWTMGFDFRIMFLTIFKGFVNENAY